MLQLKTLGECVIQTETTRIGPDSKMVFALLLYLALERGKRVPRSTLAELFWPTSPADKAAHSLRQTMYQCRKLGAEIDASKTELTIPANGVTTDLDTIESLMSAENRAEAGAFLPGYNPDLSSEFAEWLDRHRSIVQAKIRRHLLIEMASRKSAGEWEAATTTAHDLLRVDPLNEEATLVLAEATAMSGNKAAALQILDNFARDVDHNAQLTLPANVLRKRIAEQFKESDRAATPLVGRTDVLADVNQLLKHAKKGEGRTVLFWGPPGIGKTRLVTEIEKTACLQGFQVARVECQVADTTRPLSAFMEIVPRLLELRGALGCSPQSLSVLRRLTEYHADSAAPAADRDGAQNLSGHVRRALLDLLEAITAETALLLLFEDVHWLDGSSWEILRLLHRWSTSRRVLTLQTSRRLCTDSDPSDGNDAVLTLGLNPLIEEDARRLFCDAARAASSPISNEDRAWFLEVAGGNPYFVTELARHHVLEGKPHTIPASLGSLLTQRVQRLSPRGLRLLHVIAVLGRHSTFHRWREVLESETFEILAALEELELEGLVVSAGITVTAKHALLAESALRLCTPAAKRFIHRRVGEVLEAEFLVTKSASLLWTCTEHWRLAGDETRALDFAHSGSNHLIQLGLLAEAVTVLEGLLQLEKAREPDVRCAILSSIARAHRANRDWPSTLRALEARQSIQALLKGVECVHDEDELILIEVSWYNDFLNDDARNQYHLDRLSQCARAIESSPSHRLEAAHWGIASADNGSAPEVMDKIYSSIQPLLKREDLPLATRLWVRLIYETVRGDLDQAMGITHELVDCYRDGSISDQIRALHNGSIPFRYAGCFEQCEMFLRKAATIAGERKLWVHYSEVQDALAAVYLSDDRISDAICTIEHAIAKLPETAPGYGRASLEVLRMQMAIANGDYDTARALQRHLRIPLHNTGIRGRDYAVAARLILDWLDGKKPEIRMLVDLDGSLSRGGSLGRRDFSMLGLIVGHCAVGDYARADSLLTDYLLTQRRERYHLPAHFQSSLNRLVPGFCDRVAVQTALASHRRATGSKSLTGT